MKYAALVGVSGCVLAVLATDAEARSSRARQLARSAISEFQAGCKIDDCKVFYSAAKKLRTAVKLEPNAKYARVYCEFFDEAQGRLKLAASYYREAMKMCDMALMYHPDQKVRTRASSLALSVRNSLRTKSPGALSDPIAAAKALYGEGFRITRKGKKVDFRFGRVSFDHLQHYIRDWYIPAVLVNEFDSLTLTRPKEKLQICYNIAGLLGDPDKTRSLEQYCEYQAALEANSTMHIFRGSEEQTFDKPSRIFTLQVVEKEFLYNPLVSVSDRVAVDDYAGVALQEELVNTILTRGRKHAHYGEAARLRKRLDGVIAAKGKALAAAEKKLTRGRPAVALFAEPARGWELPAIAKSGVRCDRLYARGYGPKRGYVEVEVKVDGKTCHTELGSKKVDSWVVRERGCGPELAAPGKHRIEVAMYGTRWRKTGGKRVTIRRTRIDVQALEDYKRTRRLARGSQLCTQ